MSELKMKLQHKLFEAYAELCRRAKTGKVGESQRMYGVMLGLRMALMNLNELEGAEREAFAGGERNAPAPARQPG